MKKLLPLLITALAIPLLATEHTTVRKSPFKEKVDSVIQGNATSPLNKIFLTYDEHGNNTLRTYYRYVNETWTETQKVHYTYDNKNNLTSSWLANLTDGKWTPSSGKDVYTYDLQRRMTSEAEYIWNDTTETWVPYSKYGYSYNDFDSIAERIQYSPNDFGDDEWRVFLKRNYTYDANKKVILVTEVEKKGDSWLDSRKYEYTNDASGNCVEEIHTYYKLNVGTPKYRTTYQYNVNNQVIEEIDYSRSGVDWIYHQKKETSYNNGGSITSQALYYFTDGTWDPKGKEEHIYDANQNRTSFIAYDYDGEWKTDFKLVNTYDLTAAAKDIYYPEMVSYTNKTLSESIFIWSDNKGEWTESANSTFYYSPLITPILIAEAAVAKTDIQLKRLGHTLSLNIHDKGVAELSLLSFNGRVLQQKQFKVTTSVDTRSLAQGIYILQVQTGLGKKQFRFAK